METRRDLTKEKKIRLSDTEEIECIAKHRGDSDTADPIMEGDWPPERRLDFQTYLLSYLHVHCSSLHSMEST